MEVIRPIKERILKKAVKAAVGCISLLAVLSGCSNAKAPETSQARPIKTIKLTPNMIGFLKNPTTCLNGGPRPCALRLRTAPELPSSYINTDPSGNKYVPWPLETYDGKPGNPVDIVCYISNGQIDSGYNRPGYKAIPPSRYWYELLVPKDHIVNIDDKKNPTIPSATNPPFQYVHLGGQTYAYGDASVEWFDESRPQPSVPECSSP
ncbi:MAG TPA: hypothetical protein VMR34_03010 [Candidatus Saccharimonadales bacterium]|nr:hypothetical protein [Candidatus Saccharimonadales bacterium]